MFKIFKTLRRVSNIINNVNIPKTIYWNFKLFPFKIAKRLPVFIGYHVEFKNVSRGKIKLKSQTPKRGTVRLGIISFPMFSKKGVSTLIRIENGSCIELGDNIEVAPGCSLIATLGGNIEMGSDVTISMFCLLYTNKDIKIGSHIRMGWMCQIYDTAFHCMIDTENGNIKNPAKRIVIEDNVWLANRVTVVAGAYIPTFTTAASQSFVNKDFSKIGKGVFGGILMGSPAKFKDSHRVRLLNNGVEGCLRGVYFGQKNLDIVNIEDVGYNVEPLAAHKNILYNS